jgi:hypothetical protein
MYGKVLQKWRKVHPVICVECCMLVTYFRLCFCVFLLLFNTLLKDCRVTGFLSSQLEKRIFVDLLKAQNIWKLANAWYSEKVVRKRLETYQNYSPQPAHSNSNSKARRSQKCAHKGPRLFPVTPILLRQTLRSPQSGGVAENGVMESRWKTKKIFSKTMIRIPKTNLKARWFFRSMGWSFL